MAGRLAIARHVEITNVLEPVKASEEIALVDEITRNRDYTIEDDEREFIEQPADRELDPNSS